MNQPEPITISDVPRVEQDTEALTLVVPLSGTPNETWDRAFMEAYPSSSAEVVGETLRVEIDAPSDVQAVLSTTRDAMQTANRARALTDQVAAWWQAQAVDTAEQAEPEPRPPASAATQGTGGSGPGLGITLVWLTILTASAFLIASLSATDAPPNDSTSASTPTTTAASPGISIAPFVPQDGSTGTTRPASTTTTRPTTTTSVPDFVAEINANLPYTLGGVRLGGGAQTTIDYLTQPEMLGQPRSDTGWVTPTWERGWLWCWDSFTHERILVWDGVTLLLGRGAQELFYGPIDRVIAVSTWLPDTPSPTLLTPEGLTVGDTEGRLLDLYPRAKFRDDPSYGPHHILRGNDSGLVAFLDETGNVRLIFLGFGCGD